ncbi:hypothetical protein PR202_gb24657 [Eleusine coracana subsp. coracana]|uniref:Uncharacterized protein n=1 Tax=Eleusine coracana subsp. coracana TaxID=191504 RepID=A0AAV5FMY9_ELECO|nr:hypothetical protein PR202_gb24657 [Eleusine coracana subsp. coracana]
MSVVGFDLGNESCIVAVARQRGIDVVLNEESKRETPAIVCFGDKQRFIGTAGAASSTMNPKNSISQIKRLLGRSSLTLSCSEWTFTPTQLLAMVLSNLKGIAEGNLKAAVVDCCIGIPVYFTDLQRRAVLDAATIAGLRPLRLFHETTATALAYGIYKTDLPENDQLNVAFVDVGHASMQVSIVGYKKGQLKMLSHAYDRSLGGRDFDEALLRVACEKLKKVLSANPEAPLNIECLMDEKDVRGFIKREEFEQISAPLDQASRVPAIIKIITDFFGKEPRRTMNASECVARGCALQCAILSPTFQSAGISAIILPLMVNEGFPFSIALSWKPDSQNNTPHQTVVFPKGNPIPSVKALTFYRSDTFEVDVLYVDTGDSQIAQKISTYTIGPFQPSKGEKAKLKVKVRLNIHGIVTVDSATMLLEDEDVEVPVSSTTEDPKSTETAEGATAAENGAQNTEEKSVPMDTDAKVEPSKKKVKKTNVPVYELVYGALEAAELQEAVEKEYEMALQDRVMEDTKEKKNAVEAYVYDMRNKLYDKYSDFVMPEEKDGLIAKLQEVEDWLYEDGEDETKGVYIAKLEELKKVDFFTALLLLILVILSRHGYKEWMERGSAIDQLVYTASSSFREAALSNDQKFDHIEISEKQKVGRVMFIFVISCHAIARQENVLVIRISAVVWFCKPIMTKPKPAPKPQTPPPQAETPAQEPQTQEQPQNGAAAGGEPTSEGGAQEPAGEQMETDKPDNSES